MNKSNTNWLMKKSEFYNIELQNAMLSLLCGYVDLANEKTVQYNEFMVCIANHLWLEI